MLHRRRFLKSASAVALGGMVMPVLPARAAAQAGKAGKAGKGPVDEESLLRPGVLPDQALGNPDAKVRIVEYMSMTCGYCADFHNKTFGEIKERYIDTGKVYFVIREFPLDPLASAGFMLARNAPGGRYFDVVSMLFKTQAEWAFVPDPLTGLRNVSKQLGYSPATFEATLSDQKLLDGLTASRDRGSKEFGVTGTPTFFINGAREVGFMTVEELSGKIEALL